jgi:hypothetical protein
MISTPPYCASLSPTGFGHLAPESATARSLSATASAVVESTLIGVIKARSNVDVAVVVAVI